MNASIEKNFDNFNYLDLLPNGNQEISSQFFQKIFDLVIDFIGKTMSRSEKILDFKNPEELKKHFNFEIPAEPKSLNEVLDDCTKIMNSCVKTGHPRFFNQLSQGLDLVSLAGEFITATTNTNMFTYEIAPVYNLMEESVLRKMRSLFGWQEPGDGIFNPGGSISNLNALEVALYSRFPNLKSDGLFNMQRLTVFTSKHSHYSIAKGAFLLGLGINQVRYVPVDFRGKMKVHILKEMINESINANEIPFFVNATEGTTVLGSFDTINSIADVCQEYNLWLHVDASWGGAALLSSKYSHLLEGIERADSVTWNPHKMMSSIQNDSAFLVKKPDLLLECNRMNASYLFQKDKHYDVRYDTGDKAIQCGRQVDILKVWLMWSAKGTIGFEQQINKLFELAQYLHDTIQNKPNFEIVLENPEFTNICFWYVPNRLKNMEKNSFEYKNELNKIAPGIKEKMMNEGRLMISYQPLDDMPNFFRMVVSNAATNLEDIQFMITEIERLGSEL